MISLSRNGMNTTRARKISTIRVLSQAIGGLAVGAIALGAIAIGAVAGVVWQSVAPESAN